MSKKHFHYANGTTLRTGVMVCAACRRPIGSEPYRYYETSKGYVNHHRACCANDPGWIEVDARASREHQRHAELIRDAQAFYEKWGLTDIEDFVVEPVKHVDPDPIMRAIDIG